MKVVIINPTYNEKGNIEKLIPILENDVFPQITKHEMHILVADDNSPDGTQDAVKKFMGKYKNLHVITGPKQGLGAAYIRAMDLAIKQLQADIIFEMDADFFHDPQKIPEFLDKIDEGYDMVIGTRYSDGGSIPSNWGFDRKLYSMMGNFLVRSILMRFYLHDWTGGFRAVRKEVFLKEKEKLKNFKGYTFQVAFLHKTLQDGFKVAEVPFQAKDRTYGRSKFAPAEYIFNLLKYVVVARILELKRFVKFLIVGGTGFIIQITTQELSVYSGLAYTLSFVISSIISLIFFPHQDTVSLSQAIAAGIGAESAIISNFMFNNFWTFNDTLTLKEKSPFIVRLLKFNMTSMASIIIQSLTVWIGVKLVGTSIVFNTYMIPTRIVVVIPTIIFLVVPFNYIVYNKIIWKTQHLKNGTRSKK